MITHIDILALTPPKNMTAFLTAAGYAPDSCTPLAGDASTRRYFRIHRGGESFVVMQSPPSEKFPQFLSVCRFLQQNGLRAPRLFAVDEKNGYAVLEDFGDKDYLSALTPPPNDAPTNAQTDIYQQALDALVALQQLEASSVAPPYTRQNLVDEMHLYPEWFCAAYLERPLNTQEKKHWQDATQWLAEQCLLQPQVFVHRDYHSRNLMLVGDKSPAMLDFQDAVIGPLMYDVVSLLRDAYIVLPTAMQESLLRYYWQTAQDANLPHPQQWESVWRDFNIAGAQRGLKVVGIFARLHLRDKKDSYLKDIPAARLHLQAACDALPELSALCDIVAARPCER